jgi:predicted CoA-binding protein
MATLGREARREFWGRDGTIGIVGGFEADSKLSWILLEQAQKDGIDAVPVNPDVDEVLGVSAVADPGAIPGLAGIVCVRLDPHATQAVQRAADLGVPVWLSQGTVSDEARTAAEQSGAEMIAGSCPMMYLESGSYHGLHRFFAKAFGKY